jgi:hypothetical protein
MVIDKQASSLLIIAMQSLSGKSLVDMLTLLLQQKISLRKTDDKGNDALMLAVKTKQFEALKILILHGATIGQINKKGQNALAIAIDALDLILQILKLEIPPQEPEQEIPLEEPEQQISLLTNMLGDLLTRAQNQPDWLVLRKDAINRAQYPFTREIILVSWAWPLVAGNFPLNDLAKKNINFRALHDFIQFVINSTSAVTREKIIYMLGMAGLCPPLIENMGPYIEGLTQIKSQLFGNSATGHDQTISTFIAVLEATVVKIPLKLGEQWNAYTGEISNTPVGIALNQIANAELDSCMAMSLTVESEHTTAVFKTLFETCFNLSVTETSLPATFPAFAAAPGVVADTLMAKGVYSALAIKIETAWKSIWALFEGTEMSNASSTTSNATSFLKSPRGQILLMTFKSKLSIRIFEIAQAPNVTPEAAILYSVLMQRQLNMLWQFIQTE